MSITTPTAQSPFVVRFAAYLNERFPAYQVAGQIPMFLAAFLAGQLFAGRPATISSAAYIGFAAFVAYTFAARAMDDHKDFEHDSRHYPERVLQRGLITLADLRVLGAACFVLSLVGSLVIDRGAGWVTLWWVILAAPNSVLQVSMMRNPAMKAWLEERRVLLAFTFVPFWGVGALWMAQMGAGDVPLPWSTAWLVVLWMVGPLLLEFARKSRAPEDERPTVVDYTKPRVSWAHSLGLHGAVSALVALAVVTMLISAGLLRAVGCGSPATYGALAASAAVLLGPVTVRFALRPSRERAKEVAELSASSMIVGQIVLVVAMLVHG